eukprot:gb/GEZN01004324.1/.p1 GENE.gb/GEZN01004324.1/~~gb/GEZN01004324.1/.p1  ORF type:complete len:553 (+),score=83.36 gb/GEZN01004324.1/:109-1767(+)
MTARSWQRGFAALSRTRVPQAKNEPMFNYAPGSKERIALQAALARAKAEVVEVPCVVDGEDIFTGKILEQVMPTQHGHVVARVHQADASLVKKAIKAAGRAKKDWAAMPFEDRAQIWLKAADILSSVERYNVMAAVMLGTGKNVWQAEIDAAAELTDFFRFNVQYAQDIYDGQPTENPAFTWNRLEYRPLEGFVWALSPFNFLAIGGNLAGAPALMGNTVIHKPSDAAVLGNYKFQQILKQAGLPDGVINFLPGPGPMMGDLLLGSPDFAALHFTGGTKTFNHLWQKIASNLDNYKGYPRIVGETGGKNFHFVHPSADVESVINHTIRSAFEFSGQKCSACSRAYFPKSLWPRIKDGLLAKHKEIKVGQPDDFSVFMTAVINEASFDKIAQYIDEAKTSADATIIAGGTYDKREGYFIQPTIIQVSDPKYATMETELFGPVLTVFVYEDASFASTLDLCDQTSPYALTGSIFARERSAIRLASEKLANSCGNFYINDKSTGAVVGQQPFGGARASGTNDKAGSALNLLRWVSPRTSKETTVPLKSIKYPHME